MKGSETSTPSASPSTPTSSASLWVVSPKPQPRSTTRSPAFGGCAAIAASPCAPRPPATSSRKRTKRSNSGPLQASVASRFSAAGVPIATMVRPPGLLATLERSPATHLVSVQLEQPGHLVIPSRRAVLVPVPSPLDQSERSSTAPLRVVLEQLLHLDRLLHTPRRPRCPNPCRLNALAQPLHRMKLHLWVERVDKRVEVPLVEGADELPNGV